MPETVQQDPSDLTALTVVLLTYNCAHRLAPVLEHLLALGVPVIAVDNASSDGTREVLTRCRDIQQICLPANIGAAARNVGLRRAGTPYVAFCDDDGWYEHAGLRHAVEALDAHPRLAVVNARILVNREGRLDPISAEMEASPIPERNGIPGKVLYGFMGGAVVVRAEAYEAVGGYDPVFFMGGEEETIAYKLVRAGWQMRYLPSVVVHHHPSLANAGGLRAMRMRNTLWNAWLHRRFASALRWTLFTLADTPKNREWCLGVLGAVRGAGWVWRGRQPMTRQLDDDLRMLDERRFQTRRPLLTRSSA